MNFTNEELDLITSALAQRFCFLETGQAHISWDDALNMGKDTWEQHGIRPPTREQLEEAAKLRKLWERLLNTPRRVG